MRLKSYPKPIQPYLFHGVIFSDLQSPTACGRCFICDKEDHLYVNQTEYLPDWKPGQWKCHSCQEKGNQYTFMQRLHEESINAYNDNPIDDTLAVLSGAKGIFIPTLLDWGVVPSIITEDLIVPGYSHEGTVSNLYKIIVEEDKWTCLSSPNSKRHPIGMNRLKGSDTLWLCEGPWDAMTLQDVFYDCNVEDDVLALIGIQGFQDELALSFPKRIVIAFDNDYPRSLSSGKIIHPTWKAVQTIQEMAKSYSPNTAVEVIRWGKRTYHDYDLPSGYDLSDLIHKYQSPLTSLKTLTNKRKRLSMNGKPKSRKTRKSSTSVGRGKPKPSTNKNTKSSKAPRSKVTRSKATEGQTEKYLVRERFNDLCSDYSNALHFSQDLKDSLAAMLAVIISTDLGGDQLWLRIIGPAGSGKSTLVEAASICREYTFPISMQTGFHSGYVEPGDKKKTDNSLLTKMDGCTTIIKDGDTLLTSSSRDRILAELRDIYDGCSRAHYRNKVSREYENLRTTVIICGTDELRKLNRTSLGERFLDCEILGDADTQPFIDKALTNTYARVAAGLLPPTEVEDDIESDNRPHDPKVDHELKLATAGYVSYLKENLSQFKVPILTSNNERRIKSLAHFLSLVRARKTDSDNHRPRAELATRLTAQFTKMAICLALVLNKSTIDKEVMRILRKITLDSGESYELEIVKALYEHDETGCSPTVVSDLVRISDTAVKNKLGTMLEFDVVTRRTSKNNSGVRGRNRHLWRLTRKFHAIYQAAFH